MREANQSLGAFIRARRLEMGLSQEELAERISGADEFVRQSDISRIESGRVALPRFERIERLAAVLDLSISELLLRSEWAASGSNSSPAGTLDGVAADGTQPTMQADTTNSDEGSEPIDSPGHETRIQRNQPFPSKFFEARQSTREYFERNKIMFEEARRRFDASAKVFAQRHQSP